MSRWKHGPISHAGGSPSPCSSWVMRGSFFRNASIGWRTTSSEPWTFFWFRSAGTPAERSTRRSSTRADPFHEQIDALVLLETKSETLIETPRWIELFDVNRDGSILRREKEIVQEF